MAAHVEMTTVFVGMSGIGKTHALQEAVRTSSKKVPVAGTVRVDLRSAECATVQVADEAPFSVSCADASLLADAVATALDQQKIAHWVVVLENVNSSASQKLALGLVVSLNHDPVRVFVASRVTGWEPALAAMQAGARRLKPFRVVRVAPPNADALVLCPTFLSQEVAARDAIALAARAVGRLPLLLVALREAKAHAPRTTWADFLSPLHLSELPPAVGPSWLRDAAAPLSASITDAWQEARAAGVGREARAVLQMLQVVAADHPLRWDTLFAALAHMNAADRGAPPLEAQKCGLAVQMLARHCIVKTEALLVSTHPVMRVAMLAVFPATNIVSNALSKACIAASGALNAVPAQLSATLAAHLINQLQDIATWDTRNSGMDTPDRGRNLAAQGLLRLAHTPRAADAASHLVAAAAIYSVHFAAEHPEVCAIFDGLERALARLAPSMPLDLSKFTKRGHRHQATATHALRVALRPETPRTRTTVVSLMDLASIMNAFGDMPRCHEALARASEICEEASGCTLTETAAVLLQRANSYAPGGATDGHRALAQRALDLFLRDGSPRASQALASLGRLHTAAGDHAKAVDCWEQCVRTVETAMGPEHVALAASLTNLANAHGCVGDYTRKREILERALRIKESQYGDDHVELAVTLENLGNAHGALRDLDACGRHLTRALAIRQRHYGGDHPSVAQILENIAILYEKRVMPRERKQTLLAVLRIREKHADGPVLFLTRALLNLGLACGALDEPDECRAYLGRALQLRVERCGPESPEAGEARRVIEKAERQLRAREERRKAKVDL